MSWKLNFARKSSISNISVVDPPRTLFMGLDKHESKLTNLEIFLETEEKQVWNWFSDIRPRLFYWKNIFDQTVSVRWITLSPPTSCIQFPHIKLVLSKFMIWMLLDFTSLSHPWHIVLEVLQKVLINQNINLYQYDVFRSWSISCLRLLRVATSFSW